MGLLALGVAFLTGGGSGTLRGQQPTTPAACDGVEGFHRLDFWVGDWDVRVNGTTVGRDRVEKIPSGCAIVESWTDARGSEGPGFFPMPSLGPIS